MTDKPERRCHECGTVLTKSAVAAKPHLASCPYDGPDGVWGCTCGALRAHANNAKWPSPEILERIQKLRRVLAKVHPFCLPYPQPDLVGLLNDIQGELYDLRVEVAAKPGLLPCPFCGGEALYDRMGTRRQSCIVACAHCGARHESPDQDEHNGESWNRRTPLYAVPPEVPPRAMEVLRGLFASIDEHFAGRHDDACPWHSHLTPGVWDNDSGNRRAGKAGTLCSDCVTWSAARALLQHDAPPTLRSTPELLAAFRDGVQPGIITVVHDVPPREPTPEMLKAGAGWQDLGDQEDNACQAKLTWQAMYDAFKHDAATGRPDAAARASAEDAT